MKIKNSMKALLVLSFVAVLPQASHADKVRVLAICSIPRYSSEIPKELGFVPKRARIGFNETKRAWFFEVSGVVSQPDSRLKPVHSVKLQHLTNTETTLAGADETGDNWFSLKQSSLNLNVFEGDAAIQEDFGLTLSCRK